jgi:hypothetical protein
MRWKKQLGINCILCGIKPEVEESVRHREFLYNLAHADGMIPMDEINL